MTLKCLQDWKIVNFQSQQQLSICFFPWHIFAFGNISDLNEEIFCHDFDLKKLDPQVIANCNWRTDTQMVLATKYRTHAKSDILNDLQPYFPQNWYCPSFFSRNTAKIGGQYFGVWKIRLQIVVSIIMQYQPCFQKLCKCSLFCHTMFN